MLKDVLFKPEPKTTVSTLTRCLQSTPSVQGFVLSSVWVYNRITVTIPDWNIVSCSFCFAAFSTSVFLAFGGMCWIQTNTPWKKTRLVQLWALTICSSRTIWTYSLMYVCYSFGCFFFFTLVVGLCFCLIFLSPTRITCCIKPLLWCFLKCPPGNTGLNKCRSMPQVLGFISGEFDWKHNNGLPLILSCFTVSIHLSYFPSVVVRGLLESHLQRCDAGCCPHPGGCSHCRHRYLEYLMVTPACPSTPITRQRAPVLHDTLTCWKMTYLP